MPCMASLQVAPHPLAAKTKTIKNIIKTHNITPMKLYIDKIITIRDKLVRN